MDKSIEEIECDLRRELYAQQVSRRDTVRSTIGLPLAILGFAAFGFNGLALSAFVELSIPFFAFFSALALFTTALSVFFFLSAISIGHKLSYNPVAPLPEIFDLSAQEQDLRRDFTDLVGHEPDEAQEFARAAMWGAISTEYQERTKDLENISNRNLDTQAEMLHRLLAGLGLLIFSIVLYQSLRLLAQYYGTSA